MNEDKRSAYRKIEALLNIGSDDSGAGEHERASALAMIEKLKQKYNISDEDLANLDSDKRTDHTFKYNGSEGAKIMYHVAYKVIGNWDELKVWCMKRRRKIMEYTISCTDAEAVQINFLYDFYYQKYINERSIFLDAFINKHNLFGDPGSQSMKDKPKLSDEAIERLERLLGYMKNMPDETPLKAIEGDTV